VKKNESLNRTLKNVALVVAVLGVGASLGALLHLIPGAPSVPPAETHVETPPPEEQEASVAPVDQAAESPTAPAPTAETVVAANEPVPAPQWPQPQMANSGYQQPWQDPNAQQNIQDRMAAFQDPAVQQQVLQDLADRVQDPQLQQRIQQFQQQLQDPAAQAQLQARLQQFQQNIQNRFNGGGN
jgi:hypothetical protein